VSQSDVITGEAPKRYAQALLELAEGAKSLKTVEKDVKNLKSLFAKSDDLIHMASSPVIALDDKVAALTAVAKKAKVSTLTTQLPLKFRPCSLHSKICSRGAKVAKSQR